MTRLLLEVRRRLRDKKKDKVRYREVLQVLEVG